MLFAITLLLERESTDSCFNVQSTAAARARVSSEAYQSRKEASSDVLPGDSAAAVGAKDGSAGGGEARVERYSLWIGAVGRLAHI